MRFRVSIQVTRMLTGHLILLDAISILSERGEHGLR